MRAPYNTHMRMNLNRTRSLRPAAMAAAVVAAVASLSPAQAQGQAPAAPPLAADARIVTLGGAVTEIVFALGLGDQVVAVDASSDFPARVTELPQVGYYRTLSAEGLLSLQPDLILGTEASGPPPVIDLLRRAGVRVELIDDAYGPAQIPVNIERIADALGVPERGAELAARVRSDFERVAEIREGSASGLSAMFIWNRDGPGLQVAGSETGAHTMLEVAGLRNAGSALQGYQPFNAEAMLIANPDVLIVPSTTAEGLGGIDRILGMPSVASTTAARTGNVVVVDLQAFIGFGPRAGRTLVQVLEDAQRPESSQPATADGGRLPRR